MRGIFKSVTIIAGDHCVTLSKRGPGEDGRAFLDPLDDVLARGTLAERAVSSFRAAQGDPRALVRFWQIA